MPFQLEELSSLDRWILHRCADLIETCEVNFPLANLDVITHKLNHFWRHDISKLYLVSPQCTHSCDLWFVCTLCFVYIESLIFLPGSSV